MFTHSLGKEQCDHAVRRVAPLLNGMFKSLQFGPDNAAYVLYGPVLHGQDVASVLTLDVYAIKVEGHLLQAALHIGYAATKEDERRKGHARRLVDCVKHLYGQRKQCPAHASVALRAATRLLAGLRACRCSSSRSDGCCCCRDRGVCIPGVIRQGFVACDCRLLVTSVPKAKSVHTPHARLVARRRHTRRQTVALTQTFAFACVIRILHCHAILGYHGLLRSEGCQ